MVHINGGQRGRLDLGVSGKKITTMGPSADGSHPVQQACGRSRRRNVVYCQCGQIIHAALLSKKSPDRRRNRADFRSGNICRCGTYQRIRRRFIAR
jgi:isoquinoline 1-oxidoreductase alpha subunit